MLVLSRKAGQTIHIGSDVVITILEISGKFARIGIEAPRQISILRGEVKEQIEEENRMAVSRSTDMSGLRALGNIIQDNPDTGEEHENPTESDEP